MITNAFKNSRSEYTWGCPRPRFCGASGLHGDEWRPLSLEEVRKMHIQRVLEMCQGNRLRAAQILGIGRTSLYRYLKRDGLDTNKVKAGNVEG